ncbi:MAG TPA: prepilin-type N-terminal cleavage/methylation domain-containing protein [Candidatus Acidoferrum sp.]|nr:prepilin-type N-terminal cleavage/methylation domain-containing protein [Candidatus Acidoferrum sp.]
MKNKQKRKGLCQRQAVMGSGFTLVELMVAMVVLMVGLVAVAQLVPAAIRLNSGNRDDSTALVLAQREMSALIDQPLTATSFSDTSGLHCPIGTNCGLGDPVTPKTPVGCALVAINNQPVIDFTQASVGNYSFLYTDPNDPTGSPYELRWAVITYANGGVAKGKRFLVGVRRNGGNTPFAPVNLDTMVEK